MSEYFQINLFVGINQYDIVNVSNVLSGNVRCFTLFLRYSPL
jgi:hypothetical protein